MYYQDQYITNDCGSGLVETANYTTTTNGATATTPAAKMDAIRAERSPSKHVNFNDVKDLQERKQKFLTAKYGAHQMSLIRKRLSVEMWMYDELQFLFGSTNDSEFEIDLDELLDIESDRARRNWLLEKLSNAKESRDAVNKFIDELLKRAETL